MGESIERDNQYGTAQMQDALLRVIKIIHREFERAGVQFFLYSGSLLGAVRENGFIPWDDDVDIAMDRANYEKFQKCQSSFHDIQVKRVIWIDRVLEIGAEPIKGYEPTVDIFVIDHAPDSNVVFRWKIFLLSLLQGMLKEDVQYEGFSALQKLMLFTTHQMGKLFPNRRLQSWYSRVSQIGNKRPTKFVHCTNDTNRDIRKRFESCVLSKRMLHRFEDTELYIPAAYDKCLTALYGDYMKRPPEEERKPMHQDG